MGVHSLWYATRLLTCWMLRSCTRCSKVGTPHKLASCKSTFAPSFRTQWCRCETCGFMP
ncbi:hypothetical protein PR003_g27414 [Phytophthora rubi]|uniref:Secreted protein n=1 Tax=Phytophthora rubi TaxID=129364 RepID=A0A6A3HSV1_9STRA|nr:hypothetical protein PR002_g26429 [Phytophthora rubi]KAE8974102.1 hypothetical protein PR001_g26102 [Phytophthora rubi]KAE9282407.1 hypothetical protein PR003_g27414 [Phytophthora rubi]